MKTIILFTSSQKFPMKFKFGRACHQLLHQKSFVFLASFVILLLVGCTEVTPTSLPTATFTIAQCQESFQKPTELFERQSSRPKIVDPKIAEALIEATETFLNNCTNPDLPLATQTEHLAELAQFSQVIPLSKKCGFRYVPTTQLIDVDNNGVDELILHTQAFDCSKNELVGGSGGLSAIFFNNVSEKWQGQVIWPIPFFMGEDKERALNYVWEYPPEPQVQLLDIRGSEGQNLLALTGTFYAASHSLNELDILRWEDDGFETALIIRLSDWCGQPNEWEITEDYILIPAAEATDRCEAREEEKYILQGSEFVKK